MFCGFIIIGKVKNITTKCYVHIIVTNVCNFFVIFLSITSLFYIEYVVNNFVFGDIIWIHSFIRKVNYIMYVQWRSKMGAEGRSPSLVTDPPKTGGQQKIVANAIDVRCCQIYFSLI